MYVYSGRDETDQKDRDARVLTSIPSIIQKLIGNAKLIIDKTKKKIQYISHINTFFLCTIWKQKLNNMFLIVNHHMEFLNRFSNIKEIHTNQILMSRLFATYYCIDVIMYSIIRRPFHSDLVRVVLEINIF